MSIKTLLGYLSTNLLYQALYEPERVCLEDESHWNVHGSLQGSQDYAVRDEHLGERALPEDNSALARSW
jgi:hypothetical protein